MYAVTSTSYYECTQLVDSVKSLSFSWTRGWFFGPIAYIHCTELVWPRKVTLRSTKISIKWLWPVKVTLKFIKRASKAFLLILSRRHFKIRFKKYPSLQFTSRDWMSILLSHTRNDRSMPLTVCKVSRPFTESRQWPWPRRGSPEGGAPSRGWPPRSRRPNRETFLCFFR